MPPLDFDAARTARRETELEAMRQSKAATDAADRYRANVLSDLLPAVKFIGRKAMNELSAQKTPSITHRGTSGWALPDVYGLGVFRHEFAFITTAGELTWPPNFPKVDDWVAEVARSGPDVGDDGWSVDGRETYRTWVDEGSWDDTATGYTHHIDKLMKNAAFRRIDDHREGLDWRYRLDRRGRIRDQKPWWAA